MDRYECFKQWVEESNRIVFFGGAGVSTESGIPDFRSVDGLYSQTYDYPPETILSHTFFMTHPEAFFKFYRAKMLCPDAQPNVTHRVLAQLEAEGKLSAVITQNIDGLHQRAGSRQVYELHGTVDHNTCMRCGKQYHALDIPANMRVTDAGAALDAEGVPRCSCGGILKPDVVLYEEGLDQAVIEGAVRALAQADMLIVGGTSLVVYPAAGLIRYYTGQRLVLINKTATDYDRMANLVFHEALGDVMGRLVSQ